MPQSEEVATRRANEDIITEGEGVFWLWRGRRRRCADEKAAAVKAAAEEADGEKRRSFGSETS